MGKIQTEVSLKDHTSFKIGGNAKYFLKVSTVSDLIDGLSEWKRISKDFSDSEKRIFILGGGSNLVISEKGVRGLVIHPEIKFIEEKNYGVRVGSGVAVSSLVNFCLENSLSGFEWAGGLPGTVGGAIRGNAGAFGGETKDIVLFVESLSLETLELKKRTKEECSFSYRDSVFKSGEGRNEIIIAAEFSLQTGDNDSIIAQTNDHIEYRKNRHPLHLPNAGSVFKNIPIEIIPPEVLVKFKEHIKNDPFPVLPAAKIIADSGIVGKKIGGAQISETHPNFIVNVDNATSEDIKNLIKYEQDIIKEKYGIGLEPELMFVG